jgi:hypothetical protein
MLTAASIRRARVRSLLPSFLAALAKRPVTRISVVQAQFDRLVQK